jgi:GNAT superfamily N-acetyltransferase
VPAITALVRAAYAVYVRRINREPAPMTDDHAIQVSNGWVHVAEDDGVMVGVLVVVPGTDHLLIDNVAVHPAAQGRGVGGLLLKTAETAARRLGVGELRLYTNEAMRENLAYYPRRGYRETHRGIESGFARVYFAKTLAD